MGPNTNNILARLICPPPTPVAQPPSPGLAASPSALVGGPPTEPEMRGLRRGNGALSTPRAGSSRRSHSMMSSRVCSTVSPRIAATSATKTWPEVVSKWGEAPPWPQPVICMSLSPGNVPMATLVTDQLELVALVAEGIKAVEAPHRWEWSASISGRRSILSQIATHGPPNQLACQPRIGRKDLRPGAPSPPSTPAATPRGPSDGSGAWHGGRKEKSLPILSQNGIKIRSNPYMFQIPKCPYPTNHSFWVDKSACTEGAEAFYRARVNRKYRK